MAMNNSFYGGRRGASFIIVKNYLDIPSMTNDFAQGNSFKDVVVYLLPDLTSIGKIFGFSLLPFEMIKSISISFLCFSSLYLV